MPSKYRHKICARCRHSVTNHGAGLNCEVDGCTCEAYEKRSARWASCLPPQDCVSTCIDCSKILPKFFRVYYKRVKRTWVYLCISCMHAEWERQKKADNARFREGNLGYMTAYGREWRKRNPDYHRKWRAKQKKKLALVHGDIARAQRAEI